MPRIERLQPESEDSEYSLPPTFHLKFSQEEFPAFLAQPTVVMKGLGHEVANLTVSVKDHVWDSRKREWLTADTDQLFAADDGGVSLPTASHWEWWCYYSDEMCVCDRVIVL
ncbi:hypothetical protein ACPW96_21195 [Micromonospora sp. DT81.3]|uniref:hypothetical protein n=1 Tax=Micromonospora sp. DT81.3 TaxID=3416523 RepID=UPI003CF4CA7D